MFSIQSSLDLKLTKALLEGSGAGDAAIGDVAFIICEDNTPIGVATATVRNKIAKLLHVGILEDFRGQGYGDALTRTTLFKLSSLVTVIEADTYYAYFEKFGFERSAHGMRLNINDLKFPSACGGNH